ncbi:MAG: heavy metal translocating P-type ATPase [Actinomycetota bacterium]|nr:heavy metal translocating P-type ATPase [Actinomycetota bacterium]
MHVVPGRIRLRVPRVRVDREYATKLANLPAGSEGIIAVRVNPSAASVVVRHHAEIPHPALLERLRNELQAAADAAAVPVRQREAREPRRIRRRLPPSLAVVAALGRLVGVSIPAPFIAVAVAVAAMPIARRARHSLLVEKRANIDVLDTIAIALTTLRGSFVTPAVMIGLVEIGEAIRERTARASQREMLELLESMVQFVWLEREGERRKVPIEDVRRGDTVVVYPGDRVPVDGRILDGKALIDEHQLTGEPMPVLREEGETVYASTLLRDGHVHIAVEQVGAETRAGRILRLMKDAPMHDTRIENYAARLADRAVLPSLLLSATVLTVTRNPARAASILITDFLTGIRVSVPTTVLAAVTHAAQEGILIRSGRALEQLASIDAVVFDKTGTVTLGQPTVTGVESRSEGVAPLEVLALAAAAEQRLNHPVAEAVIRYARERGVEPKRRRKWRYQIGLGVRAEIDGHAVLVGSDRLLEAEGVDLDRLRETHTGPSESLIYVARDGVLWGTMTYADPLRTETRDVVTSLRTEYGMEIHLLTGDAAETAHAVAADLGVAETNTHAELFPEEKAEVIRSLHASGSRLAFVGDGLNDLPALAYADVSVSFGGAADVARETADVVLMDDDLRSLPRAIAIARHAVRLIRQNIAIVGGANLAAVTLATAANLGPAWAAAIHNGSTVTAAVNGVRPLLGGSRSRSDRVSFDEGG